MKEVKKNAKNVKGNAIFRKIMLMAVTMQFVLMTAMTSYAANYAKNGTTWALDQAVWIIIGIMVFVAIGCYVRKATVAMITTLVIGGLLSAVCLIPESVVKVGEGLLRAIVGG